MQLIISVRRTRETRAFSLAEEAVAAPFQNKRLT